MRTKRNPIFRDWYASTWRLLSVLILASCGNGEEGAVNVNLGLLHPTPENIPDITDSLFLLLEPS